MQCQIVGLQPGPGASIAGIRRWPKEYLPTIFEPHRVDSVMEISAREAEETMRCLARVEGVLAGVSSGGAVSAALRLSARVQNAVIAVIICDRGDRYLSTGAFSEAAAAGDPAPCNVEEWPSAAARLPFHPAPHYVWVSADYDARTGQPWCPDCERSMQAAREVVRAAGGTLLEVQVGSRPQWKDAGHPFRLDPALRLTGVPTLIHWVAGAPAARLGPELEAAKTQEQAAQLIHSFVASTAAPSAASTLSKPANISAHQTATL